MTISWYVHQQFITAAVPADEAPTRLPVHCVAYSSAGRRAAPLDSPVLATTTTSATTTANKRAGRRPNVWTEEEHERFLLGLELFPQGPWKEIAAVVGTRSTRQTMTHAQKYRHKINRRLKWAAVLPPMARSVISSGGHPRYTSLDTDENLEALSYDADTLAGVVSPIDVSCGTFDATRFDADLQDLIDSLATEQVL